MRKTAFILAMSISTACLLAAQQTAPAPQGAGSPQALPRVSVHENVQYGEAGGQKLKAWRDASPVFHVAKGDAPFLIFHGTRDENVPIAQSEELADRLKQAGVGETLIKVDDVHTFQTREARVRLALATLQFFNRYLK